MNKKDLKLKSANKLKVIKSNYISGFYDEVVSDSGYVIEFALKAAICKKLNSNTYPENIRDYKTHSPEKLINLANLREKLEKKKKSDLDFFISWSLLSKWSVEFRYYPPGKYDKKTANDYINAIESEKGGVYPWIKENW